MLKLDVAALLSDLGESRGFQSLNDSSALHKRYIHISVYVNLDQPHRPHARPPGGADDHVVVHRHLHVPARLHQIAGQTDVLLRW